MNAIQALSQLSYGPTGGPDVAVRVGVAVLVGVGVLVGVRVGVGVRVAVRVGVAVCDGVPVGVGVGVDYALYLLSVQLALQRNGVPLKEAYIQSLDFTGRIVALVGVTMAAGVITWAWSPIKFQADMGILLTFMFLINLVGALLLIPALSYFLLRMEANTTLKIKHPNCPVNSISSPA